MESSLLPMTQGSQWKFMINPFFDSTVIIYILWVLSAQPVKMQFFVGFLKDFKQIFRRKKSDLFDSCWWHLHQDNTVVHNIMLVTNYLKKNNFIPSNECN